MSVKFNGGRNLFPSKSLRSCVGELGGLRVILLLVDRDMNGILLSSNGDLR